MATTSQTDSVNLSPSGLRYWINLYKDRRLLIIFLLGISSGFPWVLIGSAMSAWLKESSLSRASIGFFGSIFIAYAVNFLWSPLVDRIKLPLLTRLLGQRRSWILAMQSIILLGTVAIAFTRPDVSLLWTSLIALLIAFASATQDIAIDAYRIEVMSESEPEKIPAGAAMATSGWWTGYGMLGAPAFFLADMSGWTWPEVYLALTVVVITLMVVVLIIKEPPSKRESGFAQAEKRYQHLLGVESQTASVWTLAGIWLSVTVWEPIREFFARNGVQLAAGILCFVFMFKIGEAFLGRMSIVFYKEIGFTNTEIGTYSKLVGGGLTIVFSIVGSIINVRFGIIKGLLIGGIGMAVTNLLFSYIAIIGPDTDVFAIAVVADGFTSAFSTVTFVAFISYLTSRTFTATQYALLASLGTLGRTLLASYSGQMVDNLDGDWALFFAITAVMVIPSLLILIWVSKRLGDHPAGS